MHRAVVPVAAAFLERILFDMDPIEAICTFSSLWSCRAAHELVHFGLSQPEYVVQLCLIHTGEVSNGGHSQFFSNRGGRHVGDTRDALDVTGLPELASILRRANEVFPNGVGPIERDEIETELEEDGRTEGQRRISKSFRSSVFL